jgi:hypothetical protein
MEFIKVNDLKGVIEGADCIVSGFREDFKGHLI